MFIMMPHLRNYQGESLPKGCHLLAPGFREMEVRRSDEQSLTIRVQDGNLLSIAQTRRDRRPSLCYFFEVFNRLFRGPHEVFAPGDVVEMPGISVEVVSVDRSGFPDEVRFAFATSLDDPSLVWVRWEHHGDQLGYHPFAIPPVGEGTTIAGPF
jgi:hypothetical protein